MMTWNGYVYKPFSQKIIVNFIQVKYLVENSHDPIIDSEVFDRVQEMLKKNKKRRPRSYKNYPFSGKIICGDCGSLYGRDIWRVRSTGERYPIWYCNHKYDGGQKCQSSVLREDQIKAAFETVLRKQNLKDNSYSDALWKETVGKVTVYEDLRLVFLLRDGKEIKVKLS